MEKHSGRQGVHGPVEEIDADPGGQELHCVEDGSVEG